MKRAALALAVLLTPAPARSERLPFRSYTTAEGLAHDHVGCVVEDSRGFLWFGTTQGLSRFDGYHFATFGPEQGLPGSSVSAFLETGEGEYWVATEGGACRFLARTARCEPQPLGGADGRQRVRTLLRDSQGRIWLAATDGLFRSGADRRTFERVRPAGGGAGGRAARPGGARPGPGRQRLGRRPGWAVAPAARRRGAALRPGSRGRAPGIGVVDRRPGPRLGRPSRRPRRAAAGAARRLVGAAAVDPSCHARPGLRPRARVPPPGPVVQRHRRPAAAGAHLGADRLGGRHGLGGHAERRPDRGRWRDGALVHP